MPAWDVTVRLWSRTKLQGLADRLRDGGFLGDLAFVVALCGCDFLLQGVGVIRKIARQARRPGEPRFDDRPNELEQAVDVLFVGDHCGGAWANVDLEQVVDDDLGLVEAVPFELLPESAQVVGQLIPRQERCSLGISVPVVRAHGRHIDAANPCNQVGQCVWFEPWGR
jgi:hypothetical protein